MFFLWILFHSIFAEARPLGDFPVVESGNPRVEIDLLSDLWSSPYQTKETPQRLYQADLKVPLFKKESWRASVTLQGEGRSVGQPDLTIGENQVPIGPDLRSQSVGFAIDNQNEDKSSLGVYVSHVSASDEPFRNERDISTNFTVLYTSALEGSTQWIVGADLSQNRGYLNGEVLPILGAAYQTTRGFRMAVGFPFLKFEWAGDYDWYASLIATTVGIRAEAIRYLWPSLTLHARAGVSNRSYSHQNRIEDEKRLIFEEKYSDLGFRVRLSEKTIYGLYLGYAFDRKLFEAERVFSPIGAINRVASDFYGGIRMEYAF